MTEHDKNLERGKAWKLTPYSGKFRDINLTQDWYCPDCNDGTKLMLSYSLDCLYCPAHSEDCEYEYHNAEGREKYCLFWSKGFNYPLSYKELRVRKRDLLITDLSNNKARIVSLCQRNKEIELEIQTLNIELSYGKIAGG